MLVDARLTGPLQVFTYLVRCPATRAAVIIDPGGEEEAVAAWVEREGARVELILNTHGHSDHVAGNQRLGELLGVGCALHGADVDAFRLEGRLPTPVRRLTDGDEIAFGEQRLQVMHTPGHTPGGVCYRGPGLVFTGDTLFVGAVGRTDLQGASMRQLLSSIEHRLLPLPEDTVVYPGHDYGDAPRSTLGRERRTNPYIADLILSR